MIWIPIFLLCLIPFGAFLWLLIDTSQDEKWLIQQIRNKYAYLFAFLPDMTFDKYVQYKKMEDKEIEELKKRLRKK